MRELNTEKLKSSIEATAAADLAAHRIGHAEIIVNQNGKRIFHGLFGEKTPGEKLPAGCVYRLASMTKPVTACAVLLAVSRGDISLDDPITKYIPSYRDLRIAELDGDGNVIEHGMNTVEIKIRHLLCHVSAIGTDPICYRIFDNMTDEEKKSLDSVVELFSRQPLAFTPLSRQSYCPTVAFDVAAKIIEKVTGTTYDRYLKENIFDKLGMIDTTFAPTAKQWDRTVSMYDVDENGQPVIGKTVPGCVFESLPPTYFCAGGGLVSTAEDYSRFAEMLLNEGTSANGVQVLPAEMIREMKTVQVPENVMSGNQRWGLGVRVITDDDYGLPAGTFGWSGAYGTHFWVDPVNRITAVYMKNARVDGGAGSKTSVQFEKDIMNSLL